MFIVLEGGEGAGKSTLAAALAARIEGAGRTVLVTREPGGTAAGEALRGLLHGELAPWAETFAFLAARAQLVAEVIEPALVSGKTVICDRFEGSTFAYQGYGRGLDMAGLCAANALATGALVPDLVLLLDLPPEVGLGRKRGETEAVRVGLESLAFHTRVRAGYAALAAEGADRWVTIDATRPPAEVAAAAWAAVQPRLAADSGGGR